MNFCPDGVSFYWRKADNKKVGKLICELVSSGIRYNEEKYSKIRNQRMLRVGTVESC